MKGIFTFITLLTALVFANAKPVDENTARTVGRNFITNNTSGKAFKTGTDLRLVYKSVSDAGTAAAACFYVFNSTDGFVIVSADDNAIPVLGYSEEGQFNTSDIPAPVAKWLENYKIQMTEIISNDIQPSAEIKQSWMDLLNNTLSGAPQSTNTVNPLISTKWNQLPYYNDMCPFDIIKNKHAVTGCVATAMAQVLKYWNWPATGAGFHSYNDNTYGTQSASFGGTSYAWTSMPNSITSANTAIATLMYHCGVGVNMTYGVDESSAYVITAQSPLQNCAEYALKTYFGYKSSASGIQRSNYTDGQWITAIENELSAGRPVIYAGFGGGGGHCFVCDGFDANNYLHMNWGWGGYYDGFFVSNALNPGGIGTGGGTGGYNNSQQAIIGIEPAKNVVTGDMRLYNFVSPSANSIYYGQPFYVTANIGNYGTTDFSGDYCAAIFDASDAFIDYVQIISGQTLKANSHYTSDIKFSNAGSYALLPGNYTISVFYRPTGGDWSIVSDNGSYSNQANFTVILKNTIEMYGHNFTVTPATLYEGGTLTVKCNIGNYSNNQFNGSLNLSLYNFDGTNAMNIQTLTGLTLNANSTYSSDLTFSNSKITVSPGTYLLAMVFSDNNGATWQLAGSTYYQNPIKVTVQEAPISPDPYESDDDIAHAHFFATSYVSDAADVTTTGSNIHTTSDEDYYKIALPAGYDITMNANLEDSRYNPDGQTYTLDAVFSYSADGGNSWSNTYDDIMAPATIRGGGTLYLKVAPYFGGQKGTYLLEIKLSREKSGISPEPGFTKDIRIYPNPATDILNLDLQNSPVKLQRVILTDILGNEVMNAEGRDVKQIPVSGLPGGIYTVHIMTDKGIINRKLTIVH